MIFKFRKPWIKGLYLVLILTTMLWMTSTNAEAVIIDNDGQITNSETINDDVFLSGRAIVVDGTVNGALFVSGDSININGIINGDLFISGRSINLSDKSAVGGNLFASGQNLVINGKVNGSVFIGGATADFGPSSNVMRNVFFGGYSVNVAQGARTGRDMLIGGYQAIVKGDIAKDLKAGVGALEVNGKIGGDVAVELGESTSSGDASFMSAWGRAFSLPDPIPPGVRIGPDAKISGKLSYSSPVDQRDNIKSQPSGGIVFKTPQPSSSSSSRTPINPLSTVIGWFLDRIRLLITLTIVGGLILWLLPKYLEQATQNIQTHPGSATWKGLLTVVIGYLAIGIVFAVLVLLGVLLSIVTLGDLSGVVFGLGLSGLGLVTTSFGIIIGYASKIIVAYFAGKLILTKILPKYADNRIASLGLGIIIYVALQSIPILGWLIGLAATLIGVGAIWLIFESYRKSKKVQTISEVPQA